MDISLSLRIHNEAFVQHASIVKRLIGHASAHRTVTNHRNRVPMTDLAGTTKIAGHRKTQRSADRGGTMGRAENGSKDDSLRFVNPLRPSFCLRLRIFSRRPVSILCG